MLKAMMIMMRTGQMSDTKKRAAILYNHLIKFKLDLAYDCKDCNQTKSINCFSATSFGEKRCAECHAKYMRARNKRASEANPTYWRDRARRQREKLTDEQKRDIDLKQRYGISLDDYNILFAAQNGLCAICKEKGSERGLFVDHNHETGKVRGLLCDNCNVGIARLKENGNILENAMNYLEGNNDNGLKEQHEIGHNSPKVN